MSISFDYETSSNTLVLHVGEVLHPHDLDQIKARIAEERTRNLRAILVLHPASKADFEFEEGSDFGQQVGSILAGTNVIIAVVKGNSPDEMLSIDTAIFNTGVKLAQFETEAEARDWLDKTRV